GRVHPHHPALGGREVPDPRRRAARSRTPGGADRGVRRPGRGRADGRPRTRGRHLPQRRRIPRRALRGRVPGLLASQGDRPRRPGGARAADRLPGAAVSETPSPVPSPPCSVDGCPRPVKTRGLCAAHNWRRMKGLPLEGPVATKGTKTCKVQGCDLIASKRGLCPGHLHQLEVYGEPRPGISLDQSEYPECKADGCPRPAYARGYCARHYQQWQNHGMVVDQTEWVPGWQLECRVPGCDRHQSGRGWCNPHYMRWYQHGDPMWEREAEGCEICGATPVRRSGLCPRHNTRHESGHDASRYRTRSGSCGGRCEVCRWAHATQAREARRRRIEEQLPLPTRREIVAQLWQGETLERVAELAGLTVRQLWSTRAALPEFVAAVDRALMAVRDPDLAHGTGAAYRHGCRCPECRAAKAAER